MAINIYDLVEAATQRSGQRGPDRAMIAQQKAADVKFCDILQRYFPDLWPRLAESPATVIDGVAQRVEFTINDSRLILRRDHAGQWLIHGAGIRDRCIPQVEISDFDPRIIQDYVVLTIHALVADYPARGAPAAQTLFLQAPRSA